MINNGKGNYFRRFAKQPYDISEIVRLIKLRSLCGTSVFSVVKNYKSNFIPCAKGNVVE
jgi:hypothetical protein